MAQLTVIVPCYRNEANIEDAFAELLAMEPALPPGTKVDHVLVDDGSDDGTFDALRRLHDRYPDRTTVLRLARNAGVHNALLAAFAHARGDCITVFPPDGQEPAELIPRMFAHWAGGARLVLTVREGRGDGWLDHLASRGFHALVRRMVLPGVPSAGYGTGLIDRSVMQQLLAMGEKNTNTLLLVTWLGYKPVLIPYIRRPRTKGRSGWSLAKKVKLAIDSVVAFSFLPVRLISLAGSLAGFAALVYATLVVYAALSGQAQVKGWSALMVVLLVVSAFQMLALGVLGEYLWRTFDAVRKRPPFVIDQVLDRTKDDPDTQGPGGTSP